jgi:hypothetical protein
VRGFTSGSAFVRRSYAEIFYSDISGEQATRARFYLKREVDASGQSTYAVRGTAM